VTEVTEGYRLMAMYNLEEEDVDDEQALRLDPDTLPQKQVRIFSVSSMLSPLISQSIQRERPKPNSLLFLPTDVLRHLSRFLDDPTALQLGQTCRSLRLLLNPSNIFFIHSLCFLGYFCLFLFLFFSFFLCVTHSLLQTTS
jgi:hypothetical protein